MVSLNRKYKWTLKGRISPQVSNLPYNIFINTRNFFPIFKRFFFEGVGAAWRAPFTPGADQGRDGPAKAHPLSTVNL